MKFINDKGEVVEGTVLTDEQADFREQIVQFAHETICGGSIHSEWSRKHDGIPKCDALANYFVTKFKLVPLEGTDFVADIDAAISANFPVAIELPVESQASDGTVRTSTGDDIYF